jgi:sortase (surface protein transpeptidase)
VATRALAGAPPAAWVEPQPFDFTDASRKRPFMIARSPARFFKSIGRASRQLDPRRLRGLLEAIKAGRYSRLQMALTGMAVVVFVLGLMVSFQSAQTNHKNAAKVSALSKSTGQGDGSSVPGTVKPSDSAVRNYTVAPDLPRYIKIPKLGVNARVMQAGVKSDGSLGTPSNVYDAAWYMGSSKPGQPGAMLIDGHVSSWTTHGVFYGLKRLVAGDIIQVQRGDGQLFAYKVVKTQTYPDSGVDMQAAVRPVTPGKPGLNLITCTGRVKPGTNEFNQRIIVFAEQI